MIYVITLYYNGLVITNTETDLPYQITTDIDRAIEIANGKLANPTIYGDIKANRVSITTWENTETTESDFREVLVSAYAEHGTMFCKGKHRMITKMSA